MTQTQEHTVFTGDTPFVPIDKIVSLCKRHGFVYPNSEIYGGVSGVVNANRQMTHFSKLEMTHPHAI